MPLTHVSFRAQLLGITVPISRMQGMWYSFLLFAQNLVHLLPSIVAA